MGGSIDTALNSALQVMSKRMHIDDDPELSSDKSITDLSPPTLRAGYQMTLGKFHTSIDECQETHV